MVTNPRGISGPRWTPTEDNQLINRDQNKLKIRELSVTLNRTSGGIKLRIYRLKKHNIL